MSEPGDVMYIYSNHGPLTQIGMINQWTVSVVASLLPFCPGVRPEL